MAMSLIQASLLVNTIGTYSLLHLQRAMATGKVHPLVSSILILYVIYDTFVVAIYTNFDNCPGHTEVDGAAFAKELGYFSISKYASQMKDRKRAINPMNHQPKGPTVCQNISEKKHLDTNSMKLDLKICTENRQKSNSVE